MSRTFCIGDIHGHNKALEQVLEKVNFDFSKDTLVQLGDVVDRGPDTFECVETLLKCRNLISLKGNHDSTWMYSVKTGKGNPLYNQGGRETLLSYTRHGCENDPTKIPQQHKDFFDNQKLYHIIETSERQKLCFVHGGFNRHLFIKDQDEDVLLWDRDLFMCARSYDSMKNEDHKFKMKDNFDLVFIGHTPVQYYDSEIPLKAANIWNLDTGCGKSGEYTLTIMNIETEVFYQSSKIKDLYE